MRDDGEWRAASGEAESESEPRPPLPPVKHKLNMIACRVGVSQV